MAINTNIYICLKDGKIYKFKENDKNLFNLKNFEKKLRKFQ